MLENWRNWCRFCAKMDFSSSGVNSETDSIRKQIDLVGKCFGIAISPTDGSKYSICKECTDFVTNLENFKYQYMNVVQMFRELILQENLTHSDLQSIRLKHGVDKEEIKFSTFLIEPDNIKTSREGSVISDQFPDPLDVRLKFEEVLISDFINTEKDTDSLPTTDVKIESESEENYPIRKKRGRPMKSVEIQNLTEKETFGCSNCPKRFVTKRRLKIHEITHKPRSERCIIPCPHCDIKLCTKASLYNHIRNIHTQERPYVCDECGKRCVSKSSLREHKISHTEERTFQCSVCSKKFKSKPHLKRHEGRHMGCSYKCPNCDEKRSTMANLRLHMAVHSDVHKYKCNYCGKMFKRVKNLKDHLILHTGLRPYECQFCFKIYANSSNCLKHKKIAHPVEYAAFKASGATTKTPVVPRVDSLQPK